MFVHIPYIEWSNEEKYVFLIRHFMRANEFYNFQRKKNFTFYLLSYRYKFIPFIKLHTHFFIMHQTKDVIKISLRCKKNHYDQE